ncbi:hypothetical protein BSKO_13039 [Bryopsis sp. KO-2023]|nr:hypothetical protein BSKO_13039 [Bryopsis sp. KO-2023]
MQYVSDIERKVEKMKQESENTAHKLVQLRNQHQELVCQRDTLRSRVSMLMHRSQQREQVCGNLQFEIAQLRTQLTGTSIALGQTTAPMTLSNVSGAQASSVSKPISMANPADHERMAESRSELAQTPESHRNSGEAVPLAPENIIPAHPVPDVGLDSAMPAPHPQVAMMDEGRMEAHPQFAQAALQFSAPQPILPPPPDGGALQQGVPQFGGNIMGASPPPYYGNVRHNPEYPMQQAYLHNSPIPSPRFMPVGLGDPDRYFNWNQETEDIFPELSTVSRQAAADPSDLFSAMLDNIVSEDPTPDGLYGHGQPTM